VPGASVAAIARYADITPSSIYRWRRNLCGKLAQPTGFAAVAAHADSPKLTTARLSCPLLSGPSTMRVWIKEGRRMPAKKVSVV
jgi:hypothetical protein